MSVKARTRHRDRDSNVKNRVTTRQKFLAAPRRGLYENAKHGDEVFTGLPNIAQIDAEYRAGATISLPAFYRASRPVEELTSALADHFDHAGHANAQD